MNQHARSSKSQSERQYSGSKRRAAVANYAFGLGQAAFVAVTGIVLVPMYLSHMSLAMYGAWLATGNIITLIAVLDSGVGMVLTQRLAGALGRNNLREFADNATAGLTWVGLVGVFMAILGSALSSVVPGWFGMVGIEADQLAQAMILAALAGGLGTITQTLGALPQAWQRTVGVGVITLVSLVASVIATIVALEAGLGVVALGVSLLVKSVVQFAGYVGVVAYRWQSAAIPGPRWSKTVMRSLIRQSAPMFVARISGTIGQSSETAITALLISPSAAAILSITWRVALVARMMVGQVGSAVFAGVSLIHGTGDTQRTAAIISKVMLASNMLIALAMGLTLAMNRSIVTVWVGADLYGGDLLTLLIVISTGVGITNNLILFLLQAMGNFTLTSAVEIVEVVVRLGFVVALGSVWGVTGIVLGGILASLLSKSWWLSRTMAHLLEQTYRQIVRLLSNGWLAVAVCVAVGGGWLLLAPLATNWMQVFIQSVTCGLLLMTAIMVDRSIRELALDQARQRWRTVSHRSD